mgnify:CR=1 FL=1
MHGSPARSPIGRGTNATPIPARTRSTSSPAWVTSQVILRALALTDHTPFGGY